MTAGSAAPKHSEDRGGDALAFLGLADVASLIERRELSPVELTQHILERIERLDPTLQSYVVVTPDAALSAATTAADEIAHGTYRGPLHGVPLAVKDLCYTAGVTTAAGTRVMRDFVPTFDATVVQRLKAAGAVLTGKLRMTEGAFMDHHPELPTPLNPWDPDTWVGSSSSGSGAATAAGLCYGAIGSDTGGSIRMPSSVNGLTGVKPTWGRVSRHGTVELAASLDHIGPMARSAADAAAMLTVLAGPDEADPTALLDVVPDYVEELVDRTPLRIGVDRAFATRFDDDTTATVLSTLAVFEELGYETVDVTLPDVTEVCADWMATCAVETAAAHEWAYPQRREEYGPGLAALLEFGRAQTARDLARMAATRREFTGRMRRVFTEVDLVLVPSIGISSPTVQRMAQAPDPDLVVPTAPFDMSGQPTVTFTSGFTSRGTPLASQLVGDHLAESTVLRAAHAFQSVTEHHLRHPRL
ncbi:amidase [Rhodococcus sp. HNM0569]|uniref:amidase n=1 Tax=Rhodococcus sp. HNM0569 TaxID=2716340 RepID=UPI00146AF4D0|nr:amidase [Rhodococcus sp. HNM0569]NLU84392.1 amidase [Rhodococcus sp. HNM0569]